MRLPPRIALLEAPPTGSGLSFLARVIRKHYAPLLLKPLAKGVVLLTFGGMLVASVISIQHIQLGFGEFWSDLRKRIVLILTCRSTTGFPL